VSTRPVLVVVAMPEEAEPFLARAQRASDEQVAGGARVRDLVIDGHEVVLVRAGIGLVNAAAGAAVVTAAVRPRAIVSAGSAGGLGPAVHVGDVVVGGAHAYSRADATAFGYALGQVPGMPPTFEADAALLAAAEPGDGSLRVHVGSVVSGDAFVDGPLVDEVRATFPDALATDMESTALAQVAHLYGVPFVSVRGISDLCGAGEFAEHVDDAADRSAAVVVGLLHRLG